jgi:hypothetical protein
MGRLLPPEYQSLGIIIIFNESRKVEKKVFELQDSKKKGKVALNLLKYPLK